MNIVILYKEHDCAAVCCVAISVRILVPVESDLKIWAF